MITLYPDTNKELYLVPDYKPLPDNIQTMSKEELTGLYDNIAAAYDNAYIYHSELLQSALWEDLLTISEYLEKARKEGTK